MNETAKRLVTTDNFYKQFVDKPYRGDMTTTTIRTNKGRTIMVQHDVSSPNVYSRIHKISGTKSAASPRAASARARLRRRKCEAGRVDAAEDGARGTECGEIQALTCVRPSVRSDERSVAP